MKLDLKTLRSKKFLFISTAVLGSVVSISVAFGSTPTPATNLIASESANVVETSTRPLQSGNPVNAPESVVRPDSPESTLSGLSSSTELDSVVRTQDLDAVLAETSSQQPSIVGYLLRILFFTAVLSVILYGTLRFIRSRSRVLGYAAPHQRLTTISLAPSKSIEVVKILDTIYVLGVADSISLIRQLDRRDPEYQSYLDIAVQESYDNVTFGTFGGLGTLLTSLRSPKPTQSTDSFDDLLNKKISDLDSRYPDQLNSTDSKN